MCWQPIPCGWRWTANTQDYTILFLYICDLYTSTGTFENSIHLLNWMLSSIQSQSTYDLSQIAFFKFFFRLRIKYFIIHILIIFFTSYHILSFSSSSLFDLAHTCQNQYKNGERRAIVEWKQCTRGSIRNFSVGCKVKQIYFLRRWRRFSLMKSG